jgi:hypothetical protein
MKTVEICWNDLTKEKQEEIIRVIGGNNNYDTSPVAILTVKETKDKIIDLTEACKKAAKADTSITIEIFNDDDDDTSICVYIKSDNCTGSKYRLSPTCTLADAINEYLTVNYPYSCVTIKNL